MRARLAFPILAVGLFAAACAAGEAAPPAVDGAPVSADPYRPAPFDGSRFSNLSGERQRGFGALLRWLVTRQRAEWPETVADPPAPKPVERVEEGVRVTFVGHATVLIQVDGLNILTDPQWSDNAGPVSWLGPKRVRPPAIPFDDLPPIDAVLVSHNHYDHLDRPTLERLAARFDPPVYTGLRVGEIIPSARVTELDWWQSRPLGHGVRLTYVPAEHFSARGLLDRNRTLWGGFVLETSAGPIYFAGDTGAGGHFALIRARFGPPVLAMIPIGAYLPRWFMAPVHLDPAEALAASRTLEAGVGLGIHFGTFRLAEDDFGAPERDLAAALETARAAGAEGPGLDFRIPEHGRAIEINP
ncbi:conserved exported hypothetical protein [uncultured Alphaproteobacteria bacterium]|uniref:Metallo-beta-lactamase domain-containing protein n=1 Tax=uncultured Alphaproteobacteria bacterium TaxID=91750 RepID=A0A212JFB7_9PROT|nr:conserved exported hypothetical protein [uncultured Alphaproteobacteria bacterium]